jgi:hypothetical protein
LKSYHTKYYREVRFLNKVDQMGGRMDELEKSLQDLLEAAEEKE